MYLFLSKLTLYDVNNRHTCSRWLPGSKQFQLPKNPHDPYPQLYVVLEEGEVLQTLASLLGALGAVQSGALVGGVKSLLECMMSSAHGTRYMAANPHATMTITRCLLQVGTS